MRNELGKPQAPADASDGDGNDRPIGLIGGIGLTEVHVYAQRRAPDGLFSGCPHVHAVTDEGYYVLRGHGAVEFHDLAHGYRRMTLEPGQYVHFPPMVIHRLISDGELVILGIMGNAGLAERGEARIYFGAAVDADPSRFTDLVALPKKRGLDGALDRRDAAVTAYMELMTLWTTDRDAYCADLRRYLDIHCQAMATKAEALLSQVAAGPQAWANVTTARIRSLPARPTDRPEVFVNHPASESAYGMCGVLRTMLRLEQFQE